MAKVIVVGDAVVIKSDLALEELKTIQKYRPKALVLMGGEDNKEAVFAIAPAAPGGDCINKYGASFGGESRDTDKKATITLIAEGISGDPKEWVAENYGGALNCLNKLEANLPEVLEEIKAEKAAVMESIEVQ